MTWMPIDTSNPNLVQNLILSHFNTPLCSWLHSLNKDVMMLPAFQTHTFGGIFDPASLLADSWQSLFILLFFPFWPPSCVYLHFLSGLLNNLQSDHCVSAPCSLQFISCSYFSKGQPVHLPFILESLLPTLK